MDLMRKPSISIGTCVFTALSSKEDWQLAPVESCGLIGISYGASWCIIVYQGKIKHIKLNNSGCVIISSCLHQRGHQVLKLLAPHKSGDDRWIAWADFRESYWVVGSISSNKNTKFKSNPLTTPNLKTERRTPQRQCRLLEIHRRQPPKSRCRWWFSSRHVAVQTWFES